MTQALTFVDTVGHAPVKAMLAGYLASGRWPHALLLHGPKGVGKRVLANQWAYRLLCGPDVLGEALLPNTQSPVFAQLAAGSCPDLHVLAVPEKKASIGIGEVRQLLELLRRSADGLRVVIVDAVEDLTNEAANTLLKALEEPRPGIAFVLVSHQLSLVLPTLRSRCRLVRCGVLAPAERATLGEGAQAGAKPSELARLRGQLREQRPDWAGSLAYAQLVKLEQQQSEMNVPMALTERVAQAVVLPLLNGNKDA
jgi:DNA polymerase III subunit delta'